jgi:hypothetical protein
MRRAIVAAAATLALVGAIELIRWLQRDGFDIRGEMGWWM